MTALILNSGMGSRMGYLTKDHPKCMTEISDTDTIISRQLRLLALSGIRDVVITTGPFSSVLESYVRSLDLPIDYTFVNNPIYDRTNYIYSIYMARDFLDSDLVLMHGDLVFDKEVLRKIIALPYSAVTVSSTLPLPDKDFKAMVKDGRVISIGVDLTEDVVACQPLYSLKHRDWQIWLDSITGFCTKGETSCYAENALNRVTSEAEIIPFDVKDMLCGEIDNETDLERMRARLI